MSMNVPTGIMAALLVVKTWQAPIFVPVLQDMRSYRTERHAKVGWKHICVIIQKNKPKKTGGLEILYNSGSGSSCEFHV